ncbi:MAG: hypothetical protein ACK47C_07765 [Paracoccaceae bacterium]
MSARVVAVTRLLLDVLQEMQGKTNLTPSEYALTDLLRFDMDELQHINTTAVAEMQALAPSVLED